MKMPYNTTPLTIYIHIPYCLVKCGYCDFHSLPTSREAIPHRAYTDAVLRQLTLSAEAYRLRGREIAAIYFGGGTPSLMGPRFFEQILAALRDQFQWVDGIEITSEMNPATRAVEWLRAVRACGVNRLSIGIQSFNPKYLRFLDRDHTANDVREVFTDARRAGFTNISCDLIYSIPGQTTAEVAADLEAALEHQPNHVSAYQLTFEPGTPLEKRYRHGVPNNHAPKLDDELSLEQFRFVRSCFEAALLQRYEISNFAYEGFESQHNLNYWRYGEYLGLGSGAVSFFRTPHEVSFGKRWTTTRNVHRYLEGDVEPKDIDEIDHATAMGEYCMLGLRTHEGISTLRFGQFFGRLFEEVYASKRESFLEKKLLRAEGNRLLLTERGVELSNPIASTFLC